MRPKKIPLRKCTGCGEMKEKKQLVRIVKSADTLDENGNVIKRGEISIDATGKKSGRGAYICNNPKCLELSKKGKRLEKSFSCKIPDEIYEALSEQLKGNQQ